MPTATNHPIALQPPVHAALDELRAMLMDLHEHRSRDVAISAAVLLVELEAALPSPTLGELETLSGLIVEARCDDHGDHSNIWNSLAALTRRAIKSLTRSQDRRRKRDGISGRAPHADLSLR